MEVQGRTSAVAARGSSPAVARRDSVDTVRGFAIVAMVVAHTAVFVRPTSPYPLDIAMDLLNDVASPLFAFLIGVAAAISTRRAAGWSHSERGRYLLSWAIKAVLLLGIGWLLELRESGVFVVLGYLGATMLCALPLVFANVRWQLLAFVVVAIAGPLLNEAARDSTLATTSSGVVEELLDWTVLGPAYRVTGLLPLLLLGLLLGRWQLDSAARTRLVLAVGIVLAPIAHVAVELEEGPNAPTSGSWADLARDIGLTFVVYGSIVLASDFAAPRVRRAVARASTPLTDMGVMALTLYVLHVVVLMAIWQTDLPFDQDRLETGVGWLVMFGLLAGCAAFAMVWRRWLGTGPLERVIGVLSLRHPPQSLALRLSGPPA